MEIQINSITLINDRKETLNITADDSTTRPSWFFLNVDNGDSFRFNAKDAKEIIKVLEDLTK